jgi:hypothetical protein
MGRRIVVMKLTCSLGHCETSSGTVISSRNKKFPETWEPEYFFPFSYTPADFSYAETDESSVNLPIFFLNLFSYYLSLFHSHIQTVS